MERGDLTGAILDGRYRVLEPVAEGAMGVVYRAERVKLGRIVAIKVLHDVLPHELSGRKRFEIEAMAMAKLEHPHCASVLDVGVHGDRPYVVMDFVSGQNLKEVVATGPQPIPRATEIVRQVLSGLAHAHEHGIIHRDIKPANLVLSQKTGLGDHVKILDFGLARLHDTGQNLTSGIVVGTPAYMAPEQIRGVALDHRVDLYACGVLLFELLTGHKPFHSENDDPIDVCRMHLSEPIPRLDDWLPGIDFGELEAVVAKALAKDRDDRYASAEEYAAAIDAAVPRRQAQSTMLAAQPAMPPAPPNRPIQLASADVMSIGDVSYPPAVEVRSADVMSAVPAAPQPAYLGADPRRAAAPAAGVARSGSATPAAGVAHAGLATPARNARAGSATPAAGVARAGLATPARNARAGSATPAVGAARAGLATPATGISRGRTATPAAGVAGGFSRAAAEPPAERPSRPGTFLGLPVIAPTATGPREVAATATGPGDVTTGPGEVAPTTAGPGEVAPTTAGSGEVAPTTAGSGEVAPTVARPREVAARRPAARRRTRTIAIVAAALVAGVVVLALAASRDGAPSPVDPGAASGAASQPDPVRELVARANELAAQGDREAALDLLNRARRQYPNSAQVPYAAGRIYFSKYYWTDGLKSFRDAIRNDPSYRTDPELIKTVLRGFIMTPSYNDELAGFLRDDIGSAAQPFLEETARDHPSPAIRGRAASELHRYR